MAAGLTPLRAASAPSRVESWVVSPTNPEQYGRRMRRVGMTSSASIKARELLRAATATRDRAHHRAVDAIRRAADGAERIKVAAALAEHVDRLLGNDEG